jgi:hypothetical protein
LVSSPSGKVTTTLILGPFFVSLAGPAAYFTVPWMMFKVAINSPSKNRARALLLFGLVVEGKRPRVEDSQGIHGSSNFQVP